MKITKRQLITDVCRILTLIPLFINLITDSLSARKQYMVFNCFCVVYAPFTNQPLKNFIVGGGIN